MQKIIKCEYKKIQSLWKVVFRLLKIKNEAKGTAYDRVIASLCGDLKCLLSILKLEFSLQLPRDLGTLFLVIYPKELETANIFINIVYPG